MKSARTIRVLSIVAVVVVAAVSVAMPWDGLVLGRLTDLRIMMLLGLVTLGLLVRENPRKALGVLGRDLRPVLIFAAVAFTLEVITAIRIPGGAGQFFDYASIPLAWLAAALLGYAARRDARLLLATAHLATWLSVLGGVLGYASFRGANLWLTDLYASVVLRIGYVWTPTASDTFRAVGFERDPNYYGLIGVLALCPALAIAGFPRSRALLAGAASLVIILSGSRTAAAAALLVVLLLGVAALTARSEPGRRWTEYWPPLAAVGLVIALTAVVSLSAGQAVPLTQRLGAGTGVAAPGSSEPTLDAATSGRFGLWMRGWKVYADNPLGVFVAPEYPVGGSLHNEYLTWLVYGGPIALAVFLYLLGWLAVSIQPTGASNLGLLLATAYAVTALALVPSTLSPMMGMGYYFIGWAAGNTPRAARRAPAVAEE